MSNPQDKSSATPPSPGGDHQGGRIVPPWPVRIADALQAHVDEMTTLMVAHSDHPNLQELAAAKASVEAAVDRLRSIPLSE